MLLRRRRPTLEIHVPISPTPTFLNMAHYLVRSLRAHGGRYRDAPVVLTAGGERRDPGFGQEPWLAAAGVELRWVDEALFARESYYATGCERFRYDSKSDVVLALDADVLIAGPLDELVEETHRHGGVCGVVAHLPPVERREQWQEIYDRCGLGPLSTPCEHTGWGYMFADESLRYCPPYFNLGVLAAPADVLRRIGEVIYELMAATDTVARSPYRAQIGVSLAITRLGLPWRSLPFRWNFVNDPLLEALHASELPHLRIVHLLRRHQLHKDELYSSFESVEAMLRRTDLRVVNRIAQELLAGLHPQVKAAALAGA
ncbi:MAG TPA: hypothetical protein VN923_03035 [Thermoanaerobaculia bacterium]|nr:hypothetical protein [Thermoanaerobaculia bacterium]